MITGFNANYAVFFHIKHLLFLQESSLVDLVVHKLLLNYIKRPRVPLNSLFYTIISEGNQPGVLRRAGRILWHKHAPYLFFSLHVI